MKKVIIAVCALMFVPMLSMAEINMNDTNFVAKSTIESNGVKFRTTQRLRAKDGGMIYFYASGKYQLWDGDRLVAEATYDVYPNNEIRLYARNGETLYKATYRTKSDGRNISYLTLQGTTYYAF